MDNDVLKLLAAELPSTRAAIIAHCMPAATAIGKSYGRRYKLLDDMVSSAYLGLVQAVEWCMPGEGCRVHDTNIGPYIAVTIRRFCEDTISLRHTVPVERRQINEYVQQHQYVGSVGLVDVEGPDHRNLYETQEEWVCLQKKAARLLNDQQLKVFLALAEGQTQAMIATELGVTPGRISQIITKIRTLL